MAEKTGSWVTLRSTPGRPSGEVGVGGEELFGRPLMTRCRSSRRFGDSLSESSSSEGESKVAASVRSSSEMRVCCSGRWSDEARERKEGGGELYWGEAGGESSCVFIWLCLLVEATDDGDDDGRKKI